MLIKEWDSEKPLYDSTANDMLRQYMQYCYDCPKRALSCSGAAAKQCEAEKQKILAKLRDYIDRIDNRKYCIVLNKNTTPSVRRVLLVDSTADKKLNSLMAEYYFNETKFESDEFVFVVGYRNMMEFVNNYLK